MSDDWDWHLTDSAEREFEALDEYARNRVVSKHDEVVSDPWRSPDDYLEPLPVSPIRSSASVPSDSAVARTGKRKFSGSLPSRSAAVTPTAATTRSASDDKRASL